MRHLLAWTISLTLASVAAADGEFRAGYYWFSGLPYERIETQKLYSCGNGYSYYKPTYSYRAVQYKADTPAYTDKDWRQKLLDIAGQRDAFVQSMKSKAIEHNAYLEAIKVLGLDQQTQVPEPRYATSPYNFSAQHSAYIPNAAQGQSVYGYSYSQISDLYGSNDLQALYQQASRHTENAQSLAGEASSQFSALVQQEGGNRARVAEILAKAQLLKAAEPAPSAHVRTSVSVSGNTATSNTTTTTVPTSTSLKQLMETKCFACHAGGVIKGKSELFPNGAELTRYDSYSEAQKRRTIALVVSGDMPKDGQPLNADELALFYADLLGVAPKPQPVQQPTPAPPPPNP